jgi:hypothetical protein
VLAAALLLLTLAASAQGAERRALLVGVSRYDGFCPSHQDCGRNNLEGPGYDLEAMRKVLVERFGFTSSDITVLKDAGARKTDVLQALNDLATWAAPGREIFFYFSGHGTGPLDPEMHFSLPLPDDTAALVLAPPGPIPAGMKAGTFLRERMLLIGRDDVRPVLKQIDSKGASVIAVLDACFSQNAFRALSRKGRRFRSEALDSAFPPVDTSELKSSPPRNPSAANWPYHNVAWISAASANETALDLSADTMHQWPTFDGKPHGALTDAVLRVLNGTEPYRDADGRGSLTYSELFSAAESFMRRQKYPQNPQVSPSEIFSNPQAGAVMRHPVFGRGVAVSEPDHGTVKVALTGTAPALRSMLAGIPGIELTDSGAEYRIEPASTPGSWNFFTGLHEAILSSTTKSIEQPASSLVQSLKLRAAMRRLTQEANARSQGLEITAGAEDESVGETLLKNQPFSLMLRASKDVTLALVDLMGDGSSKVWLPALPGERTCAANPHVAANVPTRLCGWPGPAAPYGLDLIYILAAEGNSAELAGIKDRELTDSVMKVFEDVVAHHSGRVAMLERQLFTVDPQGK